MVRAHAVAGSLLFQKLAARVGEVRAAQLVNDALERSLRTEVPEHLDDLLSFTKAHLMGELVAALGARDVSGFLDELHEAARLASGVRRSSPEEEGRAIVALLDRDVFRRANTARQLIARRLQVVALHKLDELLDETHRPDVLLLEEEDALSGALFRVLSLPNFNPAIVLRAPTSNAARTLEHAGVRVFEITAGTTPSELAAAVDRVLARKRA